MNKRNCIVFLFCICNLMMQAQYDKKWAVSQFACPIVFDNDSAFVPDSFNLQHIFLYSGGPLSTIYDSATNTLITSNSVDIVTDSRDPLTDRGYKVSGTEKLLDSVFRNEFPAGPTAFNFTLLLPKKGSEFYIINRSSSGLYDSVYHEHILDRTYYGVFDMNKGAHGEVTSAKNLLTNVPPTSSLLAPVRHANGRDFWIVQKDKYGNTFYVFRSSPTEIVLDHIQTIGDSSYNLEKYGNGVFSSDGTKMGFTCSTQYPQIYDFDRCTGYFSKVLMLPVPWHDEKGQYFPSPPGLHAGQLGINFSPSGRYAYINNPYRLYQYDLQAGDSAAVMASAVLIAQMDSSYPRTCNSLIPFCRSMMGPNNKLYYSSFSCAIPSLHIINNPDSAGVACGFELFGFPLKSYINADLPNVPYYNLKALAGSGCDTIVSGLSTLNKTAIGLRVYPNPATQHITVAIANNVQSGAITILDALGQEMIKETITQQSATFSVQQWSAGIYFVEVRTKQGEVGVVKFVKEE